MTDKQRTNKLKRQLKAMIKLFQDEVLKKADKAIKSSAVPPEYIKAMMEDDSHLLAKAVLDSAMLDRPFAPLSMQSKKEFQNIHTSL